MQQQNPEPGTLANSHKHEPLPPVTIEPGAVANSPQHEPLPPVTTEPGTLANRTEDEGVTIPKFRLSDLYTKKNR